MTALPLANDPPSVATVQPTTRTVTLVTPSRARRPSAPTLRPGLVPLWRARGQTQIGADPRLALVLDGLSRREQRFVDSLAWPRHREVPLRQVVRQHGVDPRRASAIVEHLRRHGSLAEPVDPAEPAEPPGAGPVGPVRSPASAAWVEPARPTGPVRRESRGRAGSLATLWRAGTAVGASRRRGAEVAVVADDRSGALGLAVLDHLAREGVGRLGLVAEGAVAASDAGFAAHEIGRPWGEVAVARLRAVDPTVRLGPVAPEVVVLVESRVAVPFRSSGLVREDMPHLSVVTREIDVVVGPLVRPGRDACLRCLDLTRTDLDPHWPALATQLAAARPAPLGPTLRALGAATAALEVLDALDGRDPSLAGRTLELGARTVPVTRAWAPHPRCGCGAHVEAERTGGAGRRSG